jgi:acyl dehydratase
MSSARTDVGTELPVWELPVTPTLIVSTALATRDFQDVHHDRDLAQGHGSKDIFLNILTTTGLVQRFVGEWAGATIGPEFRIRSCGLRLGAPAYPYDTVRFSGTVTAVQDGLVTVEVLGAVSLGNHVNAQVVLSA